MAQRPALGRMRDHEHAAPVELAHNVVEEAAHFLDAVAVALAAWVRSIDEAPPRVEVADRFRSP
jgi:hypothetical protein